MSFLLELLGEGDYTRTVSWAFAITSSVFPMVVASLLWLFPMMASSYILKPEMDKPIEPMNSQAVLTVLVLAIGLYFLYYAISDSIYWLTFWKIAERSQEHIGSLYLGAENEASMIATAVELVISIVLLVKARTIASRMLRIAQ